MNVDDRVVKLQVWDTGQFSVILSLIHDLSRMRPSSANPMLQLDKSASEALQPRTTEELMVSCSFM
jgi:hypothetical protein